MSGSGTTLPEIESDPTTPPAAPGPPLAPAAPSLTAEERRLFDLFEGYNLEEFDWDAFKGTYKGMCQSRDTCSSR